MGTCDASTEFLQSYSFNIQWRLGYSVATIGVAFYLLIVVLFAYIYARYKSNGTSNTEDDVDEKEQRDLRIAVFFSVLFNVFTFLGAVSVLVIGVALGYSLASNNVDCVRLAKDVNAIPLVEAAKRECVLNPNAC